MPQLQRDVVSVLREVLPSSAVVAEEVAPAWLVRPGQEQCLHLWPLVQEVYGALTDRVLPAEMPPRERRRIDALIAYPDGRRRVVEVDERQHFTSARATTLDYYDGGVQTAFSVQAWRRRCRELSGREPGGGFARPCPPLFPEVGGRHRQRAFRDFLADVLPVGHGWLPTMRISDDEARDVLAAVDPRAQMAELIGQKAHANR